MYQDVCYIALLFNILSPKKKGSIKFLLFHKCDILNFMNNLIKVCYNDFISLFTIKYNYNFRHVRPTPKLCTSDTINYAFYLIIPV